MTANREPTSPYARRRQGLVETLSREGLDAFLVSHRPNVRYLTGFTGTSGWLWLTADGATLLTDGRYAGQAATEMGDEVEVETGRRRVECLEARLSDARFRAGLEAARLTVTSLRRLEQLQVEWVETEDLVEALRRRKEPEEIDSIRGALAVAEAALVEVASGLVPGATEREVAAELEYAARRRGADRMAFDTIVASGARTAFPHGVASDRPLRESEPVMIDMGCVVEGYCSDITRMAWVGGVPGGAAAGARGADGDERYEEYREVHRLVDRARKAALEVVAPGIPAREVDAAARRVIVDAGREEAFVHGAGHGVGLEVHEAPALSPHSDDEIEEGMVLTLEPAVYLAGRFGVRIEDMVAVEAAGGRRLTALETDPILP